MRRLVLAAVLAALCGCPNDVPGVTCSDSSPCEKGVCLDGICVDTSCPDGCNAVQECVMGACLEAFTAIEIVSPADGATVDLNVPVEAKLTRREGATAAPPAELKLELRGPAEIDQTLTCSADDRCRGTATFSADGAWTLQAKLVESGLRSAKVAVVVAGCDTECLSPKEECIAGACAPVLTGIEFLTPAADALVPAEVQVAVQLTADPAATTPLPAGLTLAYVPVNARPGGEITLLKVEGQAKYTGSFTAGESGTYQLTAKVPADYGELSATRQIKIDARPPTLTLQVHYPQRPVDSTAISHRDPDGSMAGDYVRRDELVAVTVTADEPLDPALVSLAVTDAGGNTTSALLSSFVGLPSNAPTCPAETTGFCKVIGLRLWTPAYQLPAARGTFGLTASGPDLAGNPGTSAQLPLRVTRFKWSVKLGGPLATAPAISSDGNVVVAHEASSGSATQPARVLAIDPDATGILDVKDSLGSLIPKRLLVVPNLSNDAAAPLTAVVGGEYRSTGTETGAAALVIKGGTTLPMCSGQFSQVLELGLMAVTAEGGQVPYVVALVAGTVWGTARLAAAPLSAPDTCTLSTETFYVSPFPGIAVDGTTVYVPGLSKLQAYSFADGAFTKQTLEVGDIGDQRPHVGPILTRNGVVGLKASVVAIEPRGSVYLFPNGPSVTPLESEPISMDLRGVASGTRNKLVVTTMDGKLLTLPDSLDSGPADLDLAGPVSSWPALGVNGSVFTLDDEGVLEASGANESWAMALGTPLGELPAFSPALDCGRDSAGALFGRPGVAYVGTRSGTLFAVVTDSPGLDAPADSAGRIWPKWAHDPQNTANAATPLSGHDCH